jgi:hypothetical protein
MLTLLFLSYTRTETSGSRVFPQPARGRDGPFRSNDDRSSLKRLERQKDRAGGRNRGSHLYRQAQEFENAAKSLRRLLGNLDLSTDQLIVVPGNHDIRWTTNQKYEEGTKVTEAPSKARENYSAFYRELFRHDPSKASFRS